MLTNDVRQLQAAAHSYLLDADCSLPSQQIARHLFGPQRHEHPEAQVVVRALLDDDPRFLETHDQCWCARGAPHISQSLGEATFAVVDLETTGSIIGVDEIIEIGVVIVKRGRILNTFSSLVCGERTVPQWVSKLTGIRSRDLKGAPSFTELTPIVSELLTGAVFVAHDIRFDLPFLRWGYADRGMNPPRVTGLCTLCLSRAFWPDLPSRSLPDLARHFNLPHRHPHRAVDDADATAGILRKALREARASGLTKLSDLFELPGTHTTTRWPNDLLLAAEASE
jgi:DNA polymerase III epsilon subunit family exonuclease